jgi:hypothetical protein
MDVYSVLKTRAKTAVDNLVAKKIPGVAPQLAKINTRMDETRFKILEEKQKQQEFPDQISYDELNELDDLTMILIKRKKMKTEKDRTVVRKVRMQKLNRKKDQARKGVVSSDKALVQWTAEEENELVDRTYEYYSAERRKLLLEGEILSPEEEMILETTIMTRTKRKQAAAASRALAKEGDEPTALPPPEMQALSALNHQLVDSNSTLTNSLPNIAGVQSIPIQTLGLTIEQGDEGSDPIEGGGQETSETEHHMHTQFPEQSQFDNVKIRLLTRALSITRTEEEETWYRWSGIWGLDENELRWLEKKKVRHDKIDLEAQPNIDRAIAEFETRNLALWSLDASADFDLETFEDAEWLMPSEDGDNLANVVQDGLVALKAKKDRRNSREEDLLVLLKFIRHSQQFPQSLLRKKAKVFEFSRAFRKRRARARWRWAIGRLIRKSRAEKVDAHYAAVEDRKHPFLLKRQGSLASTFAGQKVPLHLVPVPGAAASAHDAGLHLAAPSGGWNGQFASHERGTGTDTSTGMQAGPQGIGLQPPAQACTKGASEVQHASDTPVTKTRTRAPVELRKFKSADVDPVGCDSTDSHWSAAPTPAEVETAEVIAQYLSGLSTPGATRHSFTTLTRRPAAIEPLLYSENERQARRPARQPAPGGLLGSARLPIQLRKFQSVDLDRGGGGGGSAPTGHRRPSARRRVLQVAQTADEPPPDWNQPRFAIVAAGAAAAGDQRLQLASPRRPPVSARHGKRPTGDAGPATTRARLPTQPRMFRSQDVSDWEPSTEPSPPSSPVFGGQRNSGLLPSHRQEGPSRRTTTSARPPVRLTELHRLTSQVFSSDDAAHAAPSLPPTAGSLDGGSRRVVADEQQTGFGSIRATASCPPPGTLRHPPAGAADARREGSAGFLGAERLSRRWVEAVSFARARAARSCLLTVSDSCLLSLLRLRLWGPAVGEALSLRRCYTVYMRAALITSLHSLGTSCRALGHQLLHLNKSSHSPVRFACPRSTRHAARCRVWRRR